MTNEFPMMIPGATTDNGELEVVAPYDGAVVTSLRAADGKAIDRALETAFRLFRDRDAWLKPFERIAILEKTVGLMESRAGELRIRMGSPGSAQVTRCRLLSEWSNLEVSTVGSILHLRLATGR